MRIVVTGASGLLGSNLCMELSRLGQEVIAMTRQNRGQIGGFPTVCCDLTDRASAARMVTGLNPALIIHCAAATDIDWCETHPSDCMRVNAGASEGLALTARKLGARLVHISTDSVFDGTSGGYWETDAVAPVNAYARSKAAAEVAVARENPEALILRVNIYGWNAQPKQSLAEWAFALLRQEKVVPGFSDVIFAPVVVNDIAEWILTLAAAGCTGVYHVGSRDHASKYSFLRELAAVFSFDESLVHESCLGSSSLKTPRPKNTWLRTEKMAPLLGGRIPSIREGLQRFRALLDDGYVSRLRAAA